jgi:excisionase family DNA binding protein
MTVDLDRRIWHTVQSAVEYTGYGERTILDALRDGTLKGSQRKQRGHWRMHVDALDAWMEGDR